MAGDLRSPVSRFRLTNGGPRYSGRRKTARATRGKEKERERESFWFEESLRIKR